MKALIFALPIFLYSASADAQLSVPSYDDHQALDARTTASEQAIQDLEARVEALEKEEPEPPGPIPPEPDPDWGPLAELAEGMAPNSWRQIEDAHTRDVWLTREEDETYKFKGNIQANWGAWIGSAYDGATMYFGPGGGHATRNGNIVYALDLQTLRASRAVDPQVMVPDHEQDERASYRDQEGRFRSGGQACVIEWATDDGKWVSGAHPKFPTGAHVEAGMLYVPKINGIFWAGANPQCLGNSEWYARGYWVLDLESRQWSWYLAHWPAASLNDKVRFALDRDGNVVAWSRRYTYVLDPTDIVEVKDDYDVLRPQHRVLKTSARRGADDNHSNLAWTVFEPTGMLYGLAYNGAMMVLDPSALDGSAALGAQRHLQFYPHGMPPWGHNYVSSILPALDRVWFWRGSTSIDAYNPVDGTWVRWTHPAGPTHDKPFNKMVWVEEVGVFVLHANPDQGIWLYRPAADLAIGDEYWPERDVDPLPPDLYTLERTGEKYATMPEVMADAETGDVISIKRGNYHTCFKITVPGVTIRGADPDDRDATRIGSKICDHKGVVLQSAPDVTLQGFHLTGVGVEDDLIRQQAPNLYLRDMHLSEAGNGILSDSGLFGTNSVTRIDDSLFENIGGTSGGTAGRRHGVYLAGQRCGVLNSIFRDPKAGGHLIKARCAETYVMGSILDASNGGGSRVIDVPNGGLLVIEDNDIKSGWTRDNPEAIAYGLEANPETVLPGTITSTNNTWEYVQVGGTQGPYYLATRNIAKENVTVEPGRCWRWQWGVTGEAETIC